MDENAEIELSTASEAEQPETAPAVEELSIQEEKELQQPEEPGGETDTAPLAEPALEGTEAEGTEEREEAPPQNENEQMILEVLEGLMQEQKAISTFAQKMADDVRGMHKLYHNEYVGRLRDMQEELDCYHDIDREKVFDDILKEIAQIYCNNEKLLTLSDDEKVSKAIQNLFKDIAQFLDDHGVFLQKSVPGDKRSRFCQVVERIPTEDESLNDTVAVSRATGFCTDKRAIIKEVVDIYTYKKPD